MTLPANSTVLKAYLFWGGVSSSTSRNIVKFKTPATTGYITPTGTVINSSINSGFGNSTGTFDSYQSYVDVTTDVKNGGSGVYGIANVQAVTTGAGAGTSAAPYAGWSLAIAYSAPTEKARDLTIFAGLARVRQADNLLTIPVSGFSTPPFGAVNARIGIVAYDGDATGTGDSFTLERTTTPLNTATLTNTLNPVNDFFNSTITRLGLRISAKSPDYVNQLGGVDIDIVDNNTVLKNGDTALNIKLTTNATAGETYFPGAITTAIDLFTPTLSLTKTGVDVNGGNIEPGDILQYSMTVTNVKDVNGNGDPANNNILTDIIPVNSTYLPGTISINGVTKTDAGSDDTAEFDAANNRVVFRLGTGATTLLGGTLQVNSNSSGTPPLPTSTSTVSFRVKINSGVLVGTSITNQAAETFTGQTLGQSASLSAATPSVTVVVEYPSVRGTLYQDLDNNLVLTAGTDPRLPTGIAVTLYRDLNNNNIVDLGESFGTVDTDVNGDYLFLKVPYNSYKIKVDTSDPQIASNLGLKTSNNLSASVVNLPITDRNFGFITRANVLLVKRITTVGNTAVNIYKDDLTVPHAADDNNANWPIPLNTNSALGDTTISNFLRGAISGGKVKPGDEIEYTIYFLNAGSADASGVRICDRLLPNQTFKVGGYGVGKDVELVIGNSPPQYLTSANDGVDRTQLYAPNDTTVPASCNLKGTNTDGTLLLDLTGAASTGNPAITAVPGSTGQGAPNDSYGLLRFKTTVKP